MKKASRFYILFVIAVSILVGCKSQNDKTSEDTEMMDDTELKKDHTDVQMEVNTMEMEVDTMEMEVDTMEMEEETAE